MVKNFLKISFLCVFPINYVDEPINLIDKVDREILDRQNGVHIYDHKVELVFQGI